MRFDPTNKADRRRQASFGHQEFPPEDYYRCANSLSLLREFAPRYAHMHNHKMSPEGLAVFCDWLMEKGTEEALDARNFCLENPHAFGPDPIERLDPKDFPCLRRASEWVVGWIHSLLFGRFRVHVGPIADANFGSDHWADYETLDDAKNALRSWDGTSPPPATGLIRYQLRDQEIVRPACPRSP